MPLVEEGRQQARDLAARVPADTVVYHAPNGRSAETGRTISGGAKAADWLEPWKLGEHEGKPLDSERAAINERIAKRPDEAPGVSAISGEAGESFNGFRKRIVAGMVGQREAMAPDGKTLNITSGRALQVLDGWAKAGAKPDASVDTGEITGEKGEFSKPGQLFRVEPGRGLVPVDRIDGPGQYAAQHGATEYNHSGGGAAVAQAQRGEPGWVGNIPTSEIHVDAPRFQFKANVGQGGAGEELRGVTKYDPEKAGVTAVWKDPADGRTYVVNGHHRVELAQRTGHPEMTVRYLKAGTAQEARMKSAMINIAEGRGESTDAAKVFRDSGMTEEELQAQGVSVKGKVASEGLALSNLAAPIFNDVISGDLTPARGAVIGRGVENPRDQVALYDLVKQGERGGKRLTNDQVEELIRLNNRTATKTESAADQAQGGLFGAEEMTRSLLPEKATVSDYVRKQLATERKLFGAVSTPAAAERLGQAGNVIKAGENAETAERANQGIALYDKLSSSAGPIDGILDRAAQRIANGENANDAKQKAYREVRDVLTAQIRQLTGVPEGDAGRYEGLGSQGSQQAGGGERNSAPQPVSDGGGRERPAAPEAERGARAPSADAAHRDAEPAAAARPAAAVSSQPAQPPQPPKESPADDGVYLGSGLGALEPLFRESKAEGDAMRLKRNAAMKAVEAAREKPEEHKAGESLRNYFTAERDLWAVRVNQALDIVTRKVLPKRQDREAVAIMREFRHKPEELAQFIDGSHPFLQEVTGGEAAGVKNLDRLRPVMRQALRMIDKPTDREAKADRLYTNIAEKSLEEGRKGGWLESRWQSDEYLPHLLHPKGEGELAKLPAAVGRRQGKIGKSFGFGERRSDPYPTMVHAVADGLVPKTLDASAAFNIHADNFARARATHLLEGQLAESGLGKWGVAKNAPEGWVPLAGHSEEFSKLVPFLRPGGSEAAAQGVAAAKLAGKPVAPAEMAGDVPDVAVHRLFVPPFIERALSPVTAPDYLAREVPGFARMRTAQRGLKQAILGMSGFHLLTENVMAKADVGVRGMLKAFRTDRSDPWFLGTERDLVGSGGTSAVQGSTMDAYRSLGPGTIPTRAEVIRAYIPGSKQALEVADKITRFTFENMQRRFKVVSFGLHRDAWVKDNPMATPEQLAEAKRGIASYVNGVYGGLHWENMGWSRAMVEVGRAAFLAPDWSGSNVALAKYAFDAPLSRAEFGRHPLAGAVTKESAQARLARAFWTKQLVQGLTENQMLSLMFSGRLSPRPFQVYQGTDKEGNEVYQNVVFRGSVGDAVSLGTKLEEHGLLGAGLFVGTKAAPFTKVGMHVVTGRNDFGQQIAPAGRPLWRNTVSTGAALASDVSPVPLVMRSAQKTTFGDDSDKYLWSERILSLFGPLGQHVDPDKAERGWRDRE